MKTNSSYLFILFLSLLFLKCSDDKQEEIIKANLSLSTEEVALASNANSSATIDITSNQTKLTVSVEESAKSWCRVTVSGKTITVVANSENTEISDRTATLTVIAGKEDNIATKNVKVTQAAAPTLSFADVNVSLASEANSTVVVEANTNQPSLQATVEAPADEWCSVSVIENVLILKALTENSVAEARTATITVVAGTGINAITVGLTITQLGTVVTESLIGKVLEGGVAFWQDPENLKRYKIVSATRLEGEAWCPEAIAATATGATSEEDGSGNTNKLKALSNYDQYFAAKYCTDMGEGWYLPARRELMALFEAYNGTSWGDATNANPDAITTVEKSARAAFDVALLSLPNGVALNTAYESSAGNSLWSSTENDTDPTKVWWVRFGKVAADTGVKRSTARTVRAIKVVVID